MSTKSENEIKLIRLVRQDVEFFTGVTKHPSLPKRKNLNHYKGVAMSAEEPFGCLFKKFPSSNACPSIAKAIPKSYEWLHTKGMRYSKDNGTTNKKKILQHVRTIADCAVGTMSRNIVWNDEFGQNPFVFVMLACLDGAELGLLDESMSNVDVTGMEQSINDLSGALELVRTGVQACDNRYADLKEQTLERFVNIEGLVGKMEELRQEMKEMKQGFDKQQKQIDDLYVELQGLQQPDNAKVDLLMEQVVELAFEMDELKSANHKEITELKAANHKENAHLKEQVAALSDMIKKLQIAAPSGSNQTKPRTVRFDDLPSGTRGKIVGGPTKSDHEPNVANYLCCWSTNQGTPHFWGSAIRSRLRRHAYWNLEDEVRLYGQKDRDVRKWRHHCHSGGKRRHGENLREHAAVCPQFQFASQSHGYPLSFQQSDFVVVPLQG